MLRIFQLVLCLCIPVAGLHAQTGSLQISVKDVDSGYALQADVILDGPEQLSVHTNDVGRADLTLPAGEYRIEVLATAHKTSQTHYKVQAGANLPFTIMLDPETLPAEERPENLDSKIRAGFTLMHGYVVDADTGKPVPGVKIRFITSGVETQTDSKGHYSVSVPTPAPLSPGGMGTETVTYDKPGYKSIVFENFGITGDEMGGVNDGMQKGHGRR
jgi:hypothetical protein